MDADNNKRSMEVKMIEGLHGDSQTFGLLKDVVTNEQENLEIKSLAIRNLGYLGNKNTVELLYKIVTTSERSVEERCSAIVALDRLIKHDAERFVNTLLSIVQEGNTTLMTEAISKLGGRKDKRASKILINLLKNKDVFGVTAIALGKLGEASVSELLINALSEEKDVSTQIAIVSALGNLKDRKALTVLFQILNNKENYWELTEAVIYALTQIANEEVIEPLLEILGDKTRSYKERAAVADALGELGEAWSKMVGATFVVALSSHEVCLYNEFNSKQKRGDFSGSL